jgi:hypothetical protein
MEMVTITAEVPKAAHEVAEGLTSFIQVGAEKLKDGFQAGDDLGAIFGEALKSLPKVFSNLAQLKASADYDKGKTLLAFVNQLDRIL